MSQSQPPSVFCAIGDDKTTISDTQIKSHLEKFLNSLGSQSKVLIIPPDYTRYHSYAGKITQFVHEYYQKTTPSPPPLTILPALGTHAPMTATQILSMFGPSLSSLTPSPFVTHDWRNEITTIGHVSAAMVSEATNGYVSTPWPAQLNKLVWNGGHSLILSIGQVVPHEVMGMANFNKNLFVGVGGVEAINLSHFIGAVYGMEKMMGQADNPLRRILNNASESFLGELPLWYILTVMGRNDESGALEMRGFYIGNDIECYKMACELSLKVNFTMVDEPLKKVVVYLDEDEFHSTWLGNKAIYRTRMAIADGGSLIVLAPGVKRFGEDDEVDVLIRKYGYRGTPQTMKSMEENDELKKNLSAVAHLIHGSSEGRFSVTYCPGHLSREEVEGVGFEYGDLGEMSKTYDIKKLKDGWNQSEDGEMFYYISNPALGLWAVRSRFESHDVSGDVETSTNVGEARSPTDLPTQSANDGSGGVGGWAKPPSV